MATNGEATSPIRSDCSSDVAQPTVVTSSRNNNFNLMRLLLASLVILSHSPELTDGNRHREILTRLFGTISFGELAVDGFFLLSGFLIVKSWQSEPNFLLFLKKRVLRIYPAFIVASLVCALIVGPLGSEYHSYFAQFKLFPFLKGMVLLHLPEVPPVFQGKPYASINGPMWTILFEFRCYILVAILGLCGAVKRPYLWLTISVTTLLLCLSPNIVKPLSFRGSSFPFDEAGLKQMIHFASFFLAGGCFYLFKDRIRYKVSWVIFAAVVLFFCLFWWRISQLTLVVLGGYVLFWFAFTPLKSMDWFRKCPDISYGLYLYGWPLQKLLIWYVPSISPWLLFPLACVLGSVCGFLSWHLVEYPFLQLRTKQTGK